MKSQNFLSKIMIWRISFVALLFASILTACGDRVRLNCEPRTKNKALSATVTETTQTTETPRYGTGGKC
jgi:predicted MFS family arabinose efflux permease